MIYFPGNFAAIPVGFTSRHLHHLVPAMIKPVPVCWSLLHRSQNSVILFGFVDRLSPSARRAMPVLSTLSPEFDKENEKLQEHTVMSAVRDAAMLLMATPLLVDGMIAKKGIDRKESWVGIAKCKLTTSWLHLRETLLGQFRRIKLNSIPAWSPIGIKAQKVYWFTPQPLLLFGLLITWSPNSGCDHLA